MCLQAEEKTCTTLSFIYGEFTLIINCSPLN